MYDIQLFGRIQVRTRGVRLAGRDFGGVKPRHILALLALRGSVAVGRQPTGQPCGHGGELRVASAASTRPYRYCT